MSTKETELKLEDKPPMISIIIGSLIISGIIYFILGQILKSWEYTSILQYTTVVLIVLVSYLSANKADTVITINRISGRVYARNQKRFWEGYCSDLEVFQVLQREIEDDINGEMVKKYKIFLGLSDNTSYEIMLRIDQVKNVIEAVSSAKAACGFDKIVNP